MKRSTQRKRAKLLPKLARGEDLLAQLSPAVRAHWAMRIKRVLEDPNNAAISRHPQAGKLVGEQLVLHNGLRIEPLSYYSYPLLKMLMDNKGVHEPQEEAVFQAVLRTMQPRQQPPVMLELGAYWAFYSMWFKQAFPNAACYMVEPDRKSLYHGEDNFRMNNFTGTFIHAGIGSKVNPAKRITTVDRICEAYALDFIDILHADVQAYEMEMLRGAMQTLESAKVGYLFISTHSDELHEDCRRVLREEYGLVEVAAANLAESYSWDGLLVFKAPDYPGIAELPIALRPS